MHLFHRRRRAGPDHGPSDVEATSAPGDRLRRENQLWERIVRGLVWDDLPWEQGQTGSLARVLERFRLHDADWSMWLIPGQGLTAIIQLTSYNLLGPGWDGIDSAGHLLLLICFPRIYRFDQEVPPDPDLQAVSDIIIRHQSRELTEDEGEPGTLAAGRGARL